MRPTALAPAAPIVLSLIVFILVSALVVMSVGGGDGYLLRRSVEDTCHVCHRTDRNTPAPGENGYVQAEWDNAIKSHNSDIIGSCSDPFYQTRSSCVNNGGSWTVGKWSTLGGWGVAAGRYGEFVCTTCHSIHDTANIYLIRETLKAPDGTDWESNGSPGVSVTFKKEKRYYNPNPGVLDGIMGDDSRAPATTSAAVCEVCHSQNKYHNFTTANNINNGHFNGSRCTICHSHKGGLKPGGGGTGCASCHKTEKGDRRQVFDSNGDGTGTGGDFVGTSHHIYRADGAVQDADCQVCHDMSQHTQGAVRLKNLDSGEIYTYDPSDPSTAESHCLSCHDSNGAGSSETPFSPFSDGKILGAVPYKMSLDISAYWNKGFGHRYKRLTCLGNGTPNTGCHLNGHGSGNVGLLAKNLTLPTTPEAQGTPYQTDDEAAYELCFNCHSSYPRVTKEAILGVKQGSNYDWDHWWGVLPPYYIPSTATKFKDRYDGNTGLYYDDQEGWRYSGDYYNLHFYHIQDLDWWNYLYGTGWIGSGGWKYRDSIDSGVHCLTCHNIHGSDTQWGWVYDEMIYNHYNGTGSDQYGQMEIPDYNSLRNYPIGCTYNCHPMQIRTHNWFYPSGDN